MPVRKGLFSAFYVVRSRCAERNWHTDYDFGVGVDAFTLITPLQDYTEQDSFQLSYVSVDGNGDGDEADEACWRRYVYSKGRAIAFGDRFTHSTEPGVGHDGQQHAYLCFTFGTADPSRWPAIAETLNSQSRVLAGSDGAMQLSGLGEFVANHNAELPPGSPQRI